MISLSTLCYIEKDGQYLMLHRTVKKNDVNKDKWIGVGGHFEADESPEECLLREVWEETGYTLTSWKYRAIVTFVSGNGVTEYMSLFTADAFTGEPIACNEGELAWVDKEEAVKLNIWEGDKIFFRLLNERIDFFSLKLVYDGHDKLVSASLDGQEMELLDVLDEKTGEKTGVRRERGVVHRDGSVHGTAHVWVVRRGPSDSWEVLLQKRSEHKDSYPGCYDISAAGHVAAGEEYLPTAIRELNEELGIEATEEELHFVKMHQSESEEVFHGQPFKNHEISAVYLYAGEKLQEENLKLSKEEVESVRWMDYQTCIEKIEKKELNSCINIEELKALKKGLLFLCAGTVLDEN